MGSGASLQNSVKHANGIGPTEIYLQELFSDKNKKDTLFNEIALSSESGHINLKNRISVGNLIYYKSHTKLNPLFKDTVTDYQIIIEAHKFACGKNTKGQLAKSKFHLLLTSLYLFSHLWKIFSALDKVPDRKIYKGEYSNLKNLLHSIEGVNIMLDDFKDEDWENEFLKIDKSHHGFVSFEDFCSYVAKYISSPDTFFDHEVGSSRDDLEELNTQQQEEENQVIESSDNFKFVSVIEAVAAAEERDRLRAEEETNAANISNLNSDIANHHTSVDCCDLKESNAPVIEVS
jgi:hypothetical protein